MVLGDPPGGFDAAETGHMYIHDHDVWLVLGAQLDGILAARALADQVGLGRVADQRPDALPEQRVVIADNHPHERRHRLDTGHNGTSLSGSACWNGANRTAPLSGLGRPQVIGDTTNVGDGILSLLAQRGEKLAGRFCRVVR